MLSSDFKQPLIVHCQADMEYRISTMYLYIYSMFNVSSGNESLHFWVVYLDCNVSGGEYDGSAAWNHATISPMSVFAQEFGSDEIWIWTWIMKFPKN